MKCKKCGIATDTTCELGEYGRTFYNTKDTGKYCEPCFAIKYPVFINIKEEDDDQESNN